MSIQPTRKVDELEGNYLRRLGWFFLKLALVLGVFNVLWFSFVKTIFWAMHDGWYAYVIIITTVLLPASVLYSLVGAWKNYLECMSHPRTPEYTWAEVITLTISILFFAGAGVAMARWAILGYLTGTVEAKRGVAVLAESPFRYWFWEIVWTVSAMFGTWGIVKWWSILRKVIENRKS